MFNIKQGILHLTVKFRQIKNRIKLHLIIYHRHLLCKKVMQKRIKKKTFKLFVLVLNFLLHIK